MYLLDKKIYLNFKKNNKFLSVRNRRVPNPGFWQNKVCFKWQAQRQNYQAISRCIDHLPCKRDDTTPDFLWKHLFRCSSKKQFFRRFCTISLKSWISDFGHFEFYYFSDFLNIFSYRADTSIPTTFVAICVIDSKAGAYLLSFHLIRKSSRIPTLWVPLRALTSHFLEIASHWREISI